MRISTSNVLLSLLIEITLQYYILINRPITYDETICTAFISIYVVATAQRRTIIYSRVLIYKVVLHNPHKEEIIWKFVWKKQTSWINTKSNDYRSFIVIVVSKSHFPISFPTNTLQFQMLFPSGLHCDKSIHYPTRKTIISITYNILYVFKDFVDIGNIIHIILRFRWFIANSTCNLVH